jgi:hypothetical protein
MTVVLDRDELLRELPEQVDARRVLAVAADRVAPAEPELADALRRLAASPDQARREPEPAPMPPTGTLRQLYAYVRADPSVFDARYARALADAHAAANTPLPLAEAEANADDQRTT